MPKIEAYEQEILTAFEQGQLNSVATKAELAKFKAVAHATAIKETLTNPSPRTQVVDSTGFRPAPE